MSLYPVFIVGSPRSGTSILVSALHNAGYFGYNEGNFLSLIRIIEQQVGRFFVGQGSTHPKVLTSHIDQAELVQRLAAVLAETAESKQARTPWFDKTGSMQMVESMPTLHRIWPSARFIFAKRRGLENVVSRVIKFPRHSFEYHCTNWSGTMAAWRRVRAEHPQLPGIEVDQRDISDAPEETAQRIGAFLALSPDAQAKMSATMTRDRPQETRPGSASRVITLEETCWTDEQKAIFERDCGEQMRAYGYTLDANYRVQP
jgi:hypothetical protein